MIVVEGPEETNTVCVATAKASNAATNTLFILELIWLFLIENEIGI